LEREKGSALALDEWTVFTPPTRRVSSSVKCSSSEKSVILNIAWLIVLTVHDGLEEAGPEHVDILIEGPAGLCKLSASSFRAYRYVH
jgi:hypothetical protein